MVKTSFINSISLRYYKRALLIPWLCICQGLIQPAFNQSSLPTELWKNVSDYTFMYFPEPLKKTTEFHIQTNNHFLAFDYKTLHLKDLRIIKNPLPEKDAVRQGLDFLPLKYNYDLLSCTWSYNGTNYKLTKGSDGPEYCQLIESGKFFQRRLLTNLGFEEGAPEAEVTLEISSWPDRLAFVLNVKPEIEIKSGRLEMRMIIPDATGKKLIFDQGKLLTTDQAGTGFLFFTPSTENTGISGDNYYSIYQELSGKTNYNIELVVIPVKNYKTESFKDILINEHDLVHIKCEQIAPVKSQLPSAFDPVHGWYDVFLRNDGTGNNRIERVLMELKNSANEARVIRLNFNKTQGTGVFGLPGISAMIRDNEMNPTGIPLQLSKNWHGNPEGIFKGPWFHGFTILTIPANRTIELEFTLVNALWGKLPAASHAQLCLVGWDGGWGDNQLWDETAVGAWGESVCYEPDGGQAQSMVCDVRPLMIESTDPSIAKPQKWGWTPNVGGADFFRFYNENGEKQFITRIKSQHERNCPNLTEVTYAGMTSGYEADYLLTTSIYRTDDYLRVVYKIELKVNRQMDFSRLAIVQIGTETYSYTGERKFAFGDENGLIEEWNTQWGGSAYRKTGLKTDGSIPWISMHDAANRYPGEWGAWANRGIIVREWKAKLGGKECRPYFSEYGAVARGVETSLVEINPPPGVTRLLPGDYVEAEIVHVIIPQDAGSYYGSNENFRQLLERVADTWKPVYREAVGNDLSLSVEKGKVLQRFPVMIGVDINGEADVVIKGGIGYVPVTFSGLTDYKDFLFRIYRNGKEISLDQEVYGKDYWQTDFDPVTKTWEVTFNVPMDATEGEKKELELKFTGKVIK